MWFFGAGYYDPNTGQFLSVNKDALNRAASVLANPAGLLMMPMLILHWRRKKKSGKLPPAGLFVLVLLFTVGLAACEGAETGASTPGAPIVLPEKDLGPVAWKGLNHIRDYKLGQWGMGPELNRFYLHIPLPVVRI